ncbi:MAG: twin-arginine translocase subunit TatC [Aigarchaeota archaeon]|nr:twin-arginine translocase subunit TatC [Aigarchaeota archaeon]MDW8092604.1 twin-arginine translocase subunit TatC [Nitrososphaerota archaeon]
MTFMEHVKELRDRLKVVALSYVVSLIFWLIIPRDLTNPASLLEGIYEPMLSLVLDNVKSLAGDELIIIAGRLASPLEIYFITGAILAFITSLPVIAYETYKYINPALYPHERRSLYGFMAAFIGLYTAGALFSYFIVVPLIIRFLAFFARVIKADPIITASDYYMLVLSSIALMGLLFTTPALFVLLVRFGVVSTDFIKRNRIYIYGLLYILIAIITPDGWLVGNTVLFLPVVSMIEVALIVARRYEKRREELSEMNAKQCKFCGGVVYPDNPFCTSCGRSQE